MDRPVEATRPPVRRRRPAFRGLRLAALVLAGVLVAGLAAAAFRVVGFLESVANLGNPLTSAGQIVEAEPGSIAWKLAHRQPVNLLLLGVGGAENDAPWLTDSMMILSLDPAGRRVTEVSIPRDLLVEIDAWPNHRTLTQKINVAYEIGIDDASWPGKRPEFTGVRDRGGRLAEATVAKVTGIRFDGYVSLDFKAFRDLVDALGGVDVCLDGPLDDTQYPDYHDGYVKGGIHFRGGCQRVNGEQALQLARSRHAVQAGEASDFGRARRQQLLLNAIRRRAADGRALARAPALMNALQKNLDTNLNLADLRAIHDFSGRVPDGAITRAGITGTDLVEEFYMRRGSCGEYRADVLCPVDPTFAVIRTYFAHLPVEAGVLKEAAPVQVVNASRSLEEMGDRVTRSLQPLGLRMSEPVRGRAQERSFVYDYSEGRYPLTARWMAEYFHATLVSAATAPSPPPAAAAREGIVVVLGRDYALHWIGQG